MIPLQVRTAFPHSVTAVGFFLNLNRMEDTNSRPQCSSMSYPLLNQLTKTTNNQGTRIPRVETSTQHQSVRFAVPAC